MAPLAAPSDLPLLLELTRAEAGISFSTAAAAVAPLQVHRLHSSILLVDTRTERPLNFVITLGLAKATTQAELDQIDEIYRSAGITAYQIHVSPIARPSVLPGWLKSRGFKSMLRPAVLFRSTADITTDLEEPGESGKPEPLVKIRPATPADAETYDRIRSQAWGASTEWLSASSACIGQPDWYHYLGFSDDVAVATGAFHVYKNAAWIGQSASLQNHPLRGIDRAMIAHRIREAARLGCEWLTCLAHPDSRAPNLESYEDLIRNDFQLLYRYDIYGREPSPPTC